MPAAVYVGDGRIMPCKGCGACKRVLKAPGCAGEDTANDIFAQMLLCDIVVLASPLYCWGITSQLKALIDRSYCMLKDDPKDNSLLAGLRLALVLTGGGPIEENLDLAVPPYRAFAEYFQCRDAGTLLVPSCSEPAKMGPEIEKQARQFARKVVTNHSRAPL
ncbi:MAG: NAD(P)H-dependent oxidoreductase [Planctomycetota bacterium]